MSASLFWRSVADRFPLDSKGSRSAFWDIAARAFPVDASNRIRIEATVQHYGILEGLIASGIESETWEELRGLLHVHGTIEIWREW